MSEKVVLTKEQAKAIESQLKADSRSDIVWSRLAPHVTYFNEASPINGIDPDTLIKALYIGYEIEQTPEDKVREYYKQINPATPCGSGSRCAIRETLNALNIKIGGVNA